MKIAYVTLGDARKINDGWSGTRYWMAKSLEGQGLSVYHVGHLIEKNSFLCRFKQILYQCNERKIYKPGLEMAVFKNYAKQVNKKLQGLDYDVVMSPDGFTISYLKCEKPIVQWSDATFALLKDFYPVFSTFCSETVRNFELMESSSQRNCKLLIYSSEWAAQSAIRHYHSDPSKVAVVPFGANLENNLTLEDIKSIIKSRKSDRCNLLLVGREWARKGCDVACAVVQKLNEMGLDTQLTIVGCTPPENTTIPGCVRIIGFVDKTTPEGMEKITTLMAESHFLIHPARAECYGIVLCEANSFGTPCLVRNTGGVATIVKDNINGKVFSGDKIETYCDYILYIFENYDDYRALALSSFNEYQLRLNWPAAAQTVKRLLQELV